MSVSRDLFVKFLEWFPLDTNRTNTRYEHFQSKDESKVSDFRSPSEVATLVGSWWFHGFISKEESVKRMRDAPIGSFLLRFSEGSVGTPILQLRITH